MYFGVVVPYPQATRCQAKCSAPNQVAASVYKRSKALRGELFRKQQVEQRVRNIMSKRRIGTIEGPMTWCYRFMLPSRQDPQLWNFSCSQLHKPDLTIRSSGASSWNHVQALPCLSYPSPSAPAIFCMGTLLPLQLSVALGNFGVAVAPPTPP